MFQRALFLSLHPTSPHPCFFFFSSIPQGLYRVPSLLPPNVFPYRRVYLSWLSRTITKLTPFTFFFFFSYFYQELLKKSVLVNSHMTTEDDSTSSHFFLTLHTQINLLPLTIIIFNTVGGWRCLLHVCVRVWVDKGCEETRRNTGPTREQQTKVYRIPLYSMVVLRLILCSSS